MVRYSFLDQLAPCNTVHSLKSSLFLSKVNRGPLSPLADPIGYLYLILLDCTACRLRYPVRSHLTQELTYFVDSRHAV